MERLQKVIANSGFTSRRNAEKLILEGKVIVDGEIIRELGTKVSEKAVIIVDGNFIENEAKEYYLLNKPKKTICTTKDEHNRTTVIELIDTDKRIYPVGRLDYDTTGLLILTNDGELTNILMHPSNNVEKRYIAYLNKCIAITDYKLMKKGLVIENTLCLPTRIKIKKNDTDKDRSIIEMSIVEGRNHIVKKFFNELGYDVIKLHRLDYGFLNLEKLKVGEYRKLNIKEVRKLYEYKNNH